jgi:predicted metal-dependent HD superfamily phosphohydrolase
MPTSHDVIERTWRRWLPGDAQSLLARYREPHRHYHGVAHLGAVIADVVVLVDELGVADPAAVVAAAMFHDAVYDPRRGDNEAASAQVARAALSSWAPARLEQVCRLILSTADYSKAAPGVDVDAAAAILADADLAMVSADPNTYEAYRRGVRAEYAHLDDATWRLGRRRVLQSLMARDPFYATVRWAERTTRARANLAAELATLGDPVSDDTAQ